MSTWKQTHRRDVLEENWTQNATRLWNIPLYPLGELNAIDFAMQAQGNLNEMRMRSRGTLVQIIFSTITNWVFMYSIASSVRMLYRRPSIAAGCCLLQAISGVIYSMTVVSFALPGGPSCRQLLWVASVALSISPICVGATLLQKVYLVHGRRTWLVVVGTLLLLPQPLFPYYIWTSPATMMSSTGCLTRYPSYLPWLKLAMEMPINIAFSVAFIMVVYRQYRQFGSEAWGRLVRNGIQTMCAIVLSNFFCMLCAAFELGDYLSEMFFVLDWMITSLLLVHHCKIMHTSSAESPGTRRVNVSEEAPRPTPIMSDLAQDNGSTSSQPLFRGRKRYPMVR
ncbi:hypothetical protein THASP1DRAFT_27487 [Thamnocephalis sphaerospora]|uniref:Uncharacterized protein n=1 Tax=Thamnocephalis sphaerospora TaxID=78915 RepID=A0A4P9XXH2_9FUNG|nr:hypothetical protein THASP1DRAFT_27487 [Thamnocephalis sphaerospora]|eukprot:RKP10732.1 hypothetical protein THASP1DRAFT_27487 [Thamnocephalis sphaerospora]